MASQNITDPALGQIGLDLLARGLGATEVCDALVASTPFSAYRQLVVVDARGRTAAHSGSNTLGIHASHEGEGAIAAGNMLANDQVPVAMVTAYQASAGRPFVARLLAALAAGQDAGGEAGPVHSAGLCVVRDVTWPIVDLRIDWSERPIAALAELWTVYEPQVDAYIDRAKNPSVAPGFGVAGDDRA